MQTEAKMGSKWIVILLLLINFFPSFSHAEETKSAALTDDLGREVTVPQAPERIVSLAPSNTEILFALGLEDRIVGVTKYCNYPPSVEDFKKSGKLTVVGGYKDPDLEKILSLSPDLVLASKIQSSSTIPKLEEAGIPTFAINSNNFSGVLQSIERVGRITGKEAEASKLVQNMEERIRAISEKVGPVPKRRVLYVLWHDPLQTVGAGTVQDEIIEMAGGANIFHDLSGYPLIDPEAIVKRNPEIIVSGTGTGEKRNDSFNWAKTEDRINYTDAREHNRIYQVQGDLITRAGPRIVDAVEMMAAIIHPEVFLTAFSVFIGQSAQGVHYVV